jgi:glycerol-3-phosphate dehydrogenase
MRALFLDAKASIEMAPKVATLMASELGYDNAWQVRQVEQYNKVAEGYFLRDWKS